MSNCTSCGAEIVWAWVGRGSRMPLDAAAAGHEQAGLVAFNPDTGGGRVLTNDDLGDVGEWKAKGASVHRSHFATCPNAAAHRGSPSNQLDLLASVDGGQR